jgi:PqqD family protein of HPr-rel-A system
MWRVAPGQLLEHRGWDHQFVIYNTLSGDTHLIGADAMDILLQLQQGSASQPALVAALADGAEDAAAVVAELLAELQSLALVEQI